MSLKAFHLVFITCSILLALGFAGWALLRYRASGQLVDLGSGLGALTGGLALIVYGKCLFKKLKHISYL